MINNIKTAINSKIDDSNETYRIIAKTILDLFDSFEDVTISELALKSYSSTASVIRFALSLGCAGFKELKYRIITYKNHFNLKEWVDNSTGEKDDEFYETYNALKRENIHQILELKRNGIVNQVADLIQKSSKTKIFCFSLASEITTSFVRRTRRLGKNLSIISDPNLASYELTNLQKDNFIILISLTGVNPIIRDYLNKIQQFYPEAQIAFISIDSPNDFENILNINLPNFEYRLWDNYSISIQGLLQFWDYVFYELSKERSQINEI